MRKIARIIIHHSASPSSTTVEQIRQWHLERGFKDIGYHYLVDDNGRIRYGRPLWEAGEHCKGNNADSIGVCVIGNFMEQIPTSIQYWGLRKLVKSLLLAFNNILLLAHRDLMETLCPGDNLYSLLPRIRKELEISSEDLL